MALAYNGITAIPKCDNCGKFTKWSNATQERVYSWGMTGPDSDDLTYTECDKCKTKRNERNRPMIKQFLERRRERKKERQTQIARAMLHEAIMAYPDFADAEFDVQSFVVHNTDVKKFHKWLNTYMFNVERNWGHG